MRRILLITITSIVLGPSVVRSAELPTNNDPNNQIRFATPEEAAARRGKLIRFIWPEGLPTQCQPTVTENVGAEAFKEHLKGVDNSLVRRVDRLETEPLGIRSITYLIHPAKSSDTPRLGIVHAGHSGRGNYMEKSYYDSINLLLSSGFSAAMMHMPLRGWHDDETAELPSGQTLPIKTGHNGIIRLPQNESSLAPGAGFRPFLEPVVMCINHWTAVSGGEPDVTMLGLSGGGWATHMAAALDTRIRLSIPVAGAYPLYLRNKDRGSVGDLEQTFGPLYDENIASDGSGGGVATWLEVFALGGFGPGRRQAMVTAQYDSCCFRGDPKKTVDTFKDVVAKSVKTLGQGQWEHRLDTTHRSHQISPSVLKEVVKPTLSQQSCVSFPENLYEVHKEPHPERAKSLRTANRRTSFDIYEREDIVRWKWFPYSYPT